MKSFRLVILFLVLSPSLVFAQRAGRHHRAEAVPDSTQVVVPAPVDPLVLLQNKVDSLERLLEEERSPLNKSERKELKSRIARLQKDSTQLQKTIDSQIRIIEDQTQTISALNDQIAALQPIKRQWIDFLVSGYSGKWKEVLLSQIQLDALEADIATCEEYATEDETLSGLVNEWKGLRWQKQIFDEGVSAVSSRYDKEIVNALKPAFADLKKFVAGTVREEEVELVGEQLDDYAIRLQRFQEVIKQVDKAIAEFPRHSSAWPAARKKLESIEEEMESITAIRSIPWLAEQYDAYYKALSTNCKGPNEARDTILSIEL